jgi:hypothetical protein
MNQQASPQAKYLYRPQSLGLARTGLAFLVLGGISFYFIYSPALNIPFAYHDHFRFFREDFHRPTDLRGERANDSSYKGLRQIGRPIAAEIEYRMFKNVGIIKDLTFFRYITVFMIVISATLIAVWLYYLGLPKYTAFIVSGSLFTLPGIQNVVCTAGNPLALAIFLAVVSSLSLYRLRFLSVRSLSRRNLVDAVVILCVSFLTLMAALFAYPTLASLFLLPPLTLILFRKLDEWAEIRKVVVMHLGVLGFASILYFIIVKYLSPTLTKMPASYQVGFTDDLIGKMTWFTKSASIWALNLWNIYLKEELALLVLLVICLGVLAKVLAFLRSECFSRNRGKAVLNVSQAFVAVVALVLAVNLPIILMSGGLLLFRIILPYTAVITVILFFALKGLVEASTGKWAKGALVIVFGIVFVGSAVYANFNVSNNALNLYSETLFVSSHLAKYVDDGINRIHVVAPLVNGKRYSLGYNGRPQITDEFNVGSLTNSGLVSENVRGALLQVMDRSTFVVVGCEEKGQNLQEYLKNASRKTIVVTYSETDEPIEMTPNTVVINMNDLMQVSFERNRITLGYIADPANTTPYIADSPNTGSFTAKNAFDGGTNTFWEVSGSFPHWIQTDFGTYPKTVRGYALQTGPSSHGINGIDAIGRMPKGWRFEGSNDGSDWTVLDTQANQTHWKVNERRTYNINNHTSYRYYRLYITAGIEPGILRLYEVEMME